MKIALLGYGKMGKIIEQIAIQRGHTIILKINKNTKNINFEDTDVAIDFSTPTAAVANITTCLNQKIPIISGTTGWLDNYDEITTRCKQKNGAFIYASNFSLGVNIFFELNNQLAKMMRKFNQYTVHIEETHHTQKLDAPSGTAITLAKGIIENTNAKGWTLAPETKKSNLKITAKRINNIPGTHTINYNNEVDSIEIKHTAHNRSGFALGAIIAAEWIIGKQGVFTMKDVLEL